jgi:predicted heme/steroid binding protein
MREFTAQDLAAFDGRNGQSAYVAYKGGVYDVTGSAMWADGDHEGLHAAGRDLTSEHDDAPHDVYATEFPQVGTLV